MQESFFVCLFHIAKLAISLLFQCFSALDKRMVSISNRQTVYYNRYFYNVDIYLCKCLEKVLYAFPPVAWSAVTMIDPFGIVNDSEGSITASLHWLSASSHLSLKFLLFVCNSMQGHVTQCISELLFTQKSHRSSHKRLLDAWQSGLKLKTDSTFAFISSTISMLRGAQQSPGPFFKIIILIPLGRLKLVLFFCIFILSLSSLLFILLLRKKNQCTLPFCTNQELDNTAVLRLWTIGQIQKAIYTQVLWTLRNCYVYFSLF